MGRKRKRGSAVDFKKLERLFVQHATGNTSTLSREDLKTIAREYFDLKDSSNISQKAIDFIRNARKKILMGDVSELVEEDGEEYFTNVLRDPHIAYADLVEADPEKSDSLSNTSKDVVKRACNVIHKVAEKASFTLGLTKEELLETIVAETITHSTSTVKPEMVTVQAKTRQVPELDENTPAAEIEDADGDTHNAEKRSHSPNPLPGDPFQLIPQSQGSALEKKSKHDAKVLSSRRITGNERDALASNFCKDPMLKPGKVYSERLAALDNDQFTSGNRTGVGNSGNAIRLLSSRARHEQRSIAGMDKDYATGGLHEKINSAGRLLYYAMVIPHPFGKGPPIAVAEMIANEHTAGLHTPAFSRTTLPRETSLQSNWKLNTPGIMTDFSLAIIVAAMVEYNNESYRAYLERTYKIMVGLASVEELQKLFVFTCSGHMMKTLKNTLTFLMHGNGSEGLGVFHNTFSPAKNISGDTVEDVGDAESAEASVCTAAEGLTSEEKDLLQAKQTAIKNHWNNRLESLQCKLESTPSTTKVMLCNKYYNPRFMDYCEDYLLPSIALWSKILSGDFQRFNNDYSNFKICRDTSTTGHVERYFGLLKQSKMKPSLDNFVTRHWESRRGAKRSFVDGVTASAGKMSYKKSNMQRAFMRHVKFVQDGQDSDASVEGAWEIPVEEWCKSSPSANSKRGNRLGKYQKPPRTALHFDPVSMNSNVVVDAALSDDSTSPSPKMQSRQSEPQNEPGAHKKISYQRRSSNAFKNFKKSNWPDVIRKSNVSFADCTAKLLSLWESLPDAEKSLYENTKGNDCFCGIEKEAFWVECDLCDKWYHVDCVGLGEEFADDMAYYHCYYCTEKHFRFGMNKLFHSWLTKRAVIDELQEKAEPERLIVETCAQNCAQPHVLVQYADNTIGIRNTFNNCWLNSLVQVVLGTDIYKWLLSRTYARGLNPSNIAAQIAEQLQSGDGKELTVSNNLIKELAVLMGADVNREEQMDIGDCYREVMVRFGNNTLKEYVPLSVLTVANIQYCGRCSHTSGKIEDENSILAQVLQGERDVKYNLKDLLWNSLACGYEFSEDIKCPSCKTAAADSKILNFKGLLEAPVFLPVTLERVNAGSTIPISTRVEIPLVLDMGKSIAGAYSEVIYEFFALIKWCGRRVTSGHYTAYVRDGEATVRVIDDNRIYTKDLKVLNDRATQKGVKMLFYIRKDCRTKENLPNDKLAVSIEERIDISNIVMNDGIRMTGLLGREDITSTLRGARLNGQTLDACLQTLALQDGKDIICFNSYLFELLQNNDITKAVVKKALHTANVKTADVILLPVFRSAGVGHYALMIIYPQLCLMVYADSLLPGVNAKDELKRLRHWICAKGRVATPQVGKASNIARKEYRFIKNKLVELEIQTRLPLGYLQLRMGKPAAALIEKCPIWEQLGRLMQKETLPNYDSDSTDEGNEIFVTAIRRPIERAFSCIVRKRASQHNGVDSTNGHFKPSFQYGKKIGEKVADRSQHDGQKPVALAWHCLDRECTIARKKITNDDTLYQVIAGKLTDEEVGAIVVGLNQYLEAEESEFLDMMPHEMLRKHLLTETAGRVDQGTVLHVENSDEKHSWSTIFVIEPVYDHEQRRSCINSLEAVVQKCMKIVVEKKLRSIAFAVNPGPNKNWDVHLRLKIITEAVRSQLSKLRSEQGQYISVAIVRFVAENDYFANVAREFISTL
eukprot:gene14036-15495_t